MITVNCKCGQKISSSYPVVINCPICRRRVSVSNDSAQVVSPWLAIHSYSVQNQESWNAENAKRWYSRWLHAIPVFLPDSATCGCQTHWADLTEQYPPDLSSPRAFFEWSWARHNDVSTLHSHRPTISLAEAYQLYWPDAQF